MGSLGGFGRILIGMGLLLVLVGIGFVLAQRFGLTKLPGDVVVRRGNFTFYAPIGLMLLLSILLTILLNVIARR